MRVYRSFHQEAKSIICEDNATRQQGDNVRRLRDVAALYKEGMQLNCIEVASQ